MGKLRLVKENKNKNKQEGGGVSSDLYTFYLLILPRGPVNRKQAQSSEGTYLPRCVGCVLQVGLGST